MRQYQLDTLSSHVAKLRHDCQNNLQLHFFGIVIFLVFSWVAFLIYHFEILYFYPILKNRSDFCFEAHLCIQQGSNTTLHWLVSFFHDVQLYWFKSVHEQTLPEFIKFPPRRPVSGYVQRSTSHGCIWFAVICCSAATETDFFFSISNDPQHHY